MLLGDIIERIARFFGFRKCTGCERRRRMLNAWHGKLLAPRTAPGKERVIVVRTRDGRRIRYREREPEVLCPRCP